MLELSTSIMMIKCRDCGHEYPSVMQMDTSAFKTVKIHENSEECPKRGSVSTYEKSDNFFL